MKGNPYGIKKGDRIVPLPDRKKSRDQMITNIKYAIVKSINLTYTGKYGIACSVKFKDGRSVAHAWYYADAFKPLNDFDNYEII